MKEASSKIAGFSQEDIAAVEKTGVYTLDLSGESFDLALVDFEISAEEIPGWQVAQDGDVTVALDIHMTEELKAEGMARELINRIQGIRRDMDLEVTDKIMITADRHEVIIKAVQDYQDYIKTEVLAEEITLSEDFTNSHTVELPGEIQLNINVSKA